MDEGKVFLFPPQTSTESNDDDKIGAAYKSLSTGQSFVYDSYVDDQHTLRIVVTKVPGGYIHVIDNAGHPTSVFVPEE